ncbi:hypothetical protein M758_3G223300 [Ceratodon purpureus]|nr:hypothetical protein M758_3G223300 [Ceratodon purpureus]
MAVMISASCWLTLVLMIFFPASAIARIGPGLYPSVRTIASLEETARTLVLDNGLNIQDQERPQELDIVFGKNYNHGSSTGSRRALVGSSPPTCIGRCEGCVPCKPVHVAITNPHPVISETDYYPEVWQCLCGTKYYSP